MGKHTKYDMRFWLRHLTPSENMAHIQGISLHVRSLIPPIHFRAMIKNQLGLLECTNYGNACETKQAKGDHEAEEEVD